MKSILFLILFSVISLQIFSQTETLRIEEIPVLPSGIGSDDGKIIITQSADLTNLIKKSSASNDNKFPGYRVQIYFGSGKTAMNQSKAAKEKFMYKYGSAYNSYTIYEAPYFKVRVGDFRTKAEALFFKNKIESLFPNSWVVPDRINYPEVVE